MHDEVPPGGVEVGVVRGASVFETSGAEWDALADALGVAPFLRRGWMQRWWEAFGAGQPMLFVARRGGAVVGILPMARRAGVVTSMSNVHSPMFDAIAEDAATAAELWAAAIGHSVRRLAVFGLRDRPHGRGPLQAGAVAHGRRPWERNRYEVPHIDLASTSWEVYSAARGKSLRRTVRRHRSRLEEDAPVTLETIAGGPLDRALEEMFRIEASGWKGDQGTAMASADRTRRFYTGVAHWLAEEGWLRLMILRHGDRAIAFELIVDHGGTWYPVKAGYDAALSAHSPGVIMQWEVLSAAFEARARRYDYCGEARDYTARWADDSELVRRFEVFAPIGGSVDRLALQLGRPAAKRAREILTR